MLLLLQNFRSKCIGALGYCVSRVIGCTLRVTIVGAERLQPSENYIFAFWHGKQFLPSLYLPYPPRKTTALVSSSRDGQMMATWLQCLGFRVVRGSSGRRAVAGLVLLLDALKQGNSIALATDGPRGPAEQSKKGVSYLSIKTGKSIIPLGSACSSAWILPSWDRYYLPKPFSRIVLYVGGPLDPSEEGFSTEDFLNQTDLAINQANTEAERVLAPYKNP